MNNKYYIILTILTFPVLIFSQTINDMSKIVIGVKFQNGISQETELFRSQLEDRLISFASQSGCSSFDNNTFFISPNIVVNTIDIAEGGMKNVYIAKGYLYLTIQDHNSGTIFSSISFPFHGTATKKETAIKNGILGINYRDIESIFTEAKSKILSFYQSRKDAIFARANTYATNGDYDQAIACLMMIPEDLTDMYEQALARAQEIYIQRDQNINDSILNIAKSYLAMHKPNDALNVLKSFTRGYPEQDAIYHNYISRAEGLISSKEKEIKQKEDREFYERTIQSAHKREMEKKNLALRQQIASASERIEHHRLSINEKRITALKQIACEYIRNNPNRFDYIRVNL